MPGHSPLIRRRKACRTPGSPLPSPPPAQGSGASPRNHRSTSAGSVWPPAVYLALTRSSGSTPSGTAAPPEPTRSGVADQPRRRIVYRDAPTDPQSVFDRRLSLIGRRRIRRVRTPIEQLLNVSDRRVLGQRWRLPKVEPRGHVPTVGARAGQRMLLPLAVHPCPDVNATASSGRLI